MVLLIYSEMDWVIVSPSYLCSHTNVLFMVVLHIFCYRPQSKMRVYVTISEWRKLINCVAIKLILTYRLSDSFI